jgi:hypothetical protein
MFSIKNALKVSGLVLAGAIAFAPGKAHAQVTQDIPFTGGFGGTCTFGALTGGNLVRTGTLNALEGSAGLTGFGTGAAGRTTLTCTAGGTLTTAVPTVVAVPAGFTGTMRQSVVQLGTTTNFTSASSGANFDTGAWAKPTTPLIIPGGTAQTLNVGMVAGTPGSTGVAPATGAYSYTVRLTATSN